MSDKPLDPPTIRPARAEDVALLLELFGELAEYEHLEHELKATEEQLREALFGGRPAAAGADRRTGWKGARLRPVLPDVLELPREHGGVAGGPVRAPGHRGEGVGRALLSAVAACVRERGGERLEWAALDWNELGARLLPRDRREDDERVDHPPPGRRGARAPRGGGARSPPAEERR